MTRVEGTSYVSVARDSTQTQFSRFSFKTKNHDRPETGAVHSRVLDATWLQAAANAVPGGQHDCYRAD